MIMLLYYRCRVIFEKNEVIIKILHKYIYNKDFCKLRREI